MKKTAINIHHTAIEAKSDTVKQFDRVNDSHYARWGGATKSKLGYYGGYHYLIERDGSVRQFRGDEETGAHNNKGLKRIGAWWYSLNHYGLGVSFAGNMSIQNLTTAQLKAGVELIKKLQEKHGIKDDDVTPHRQWKATQCPGNNIHDKVWEYLQSEYDKVVKPIKEDPIIKWHKKNKIIEHWDGPAPEWKMVMAWAIYKALRANANKKLDFKL